MCKLALECKVKRFVYVSTTDVYGYPSHNVPDETHPLIDRHLPYNASKVRGEQAVWSYIRRKELAATIIRPVNIYGPRGKDFVKEVLDAIADGTADPVFCVYEH